MYAHTWKTTANLNDSFFVVFVTYLSGQGLYEKKTAAYHLCLNIRDRDYFILNS